MQAKILNCLCALLLEALHYKLMPSSVKVKSWLTDDMRMSNLIDMQCRGGKQKHHQHFLMHRLSYSTIYSFIFYLLVIFHWLEH